MTLWRNLELGRLGISLRFVVWFSIAADQIYVFLEIDPSPILNVVGFAESAARAITTPTSPRQFCSQPESVSAI